VSWEIRKGDCMSHLAAMDSSSVDHVICDPPYEMEAHTLQRRVRGKNGIGLDFSQLDFAAITDPQRTAVAAEIVRVSKGWILVFCQVEAAMKWRDALVLAGAAYKRTCIWVKPDGQPQYTGDRPGMGYESIVACYKRQKSTWNGGGKCGVFTANKNENADGNVHPTQKPIVLMEQLVRLFTDYGDTILDPFCGSGSTGVAAVRCGRNFIGIEMLDKYHDVAVKRLSGTHEQVEIAYRKRKKAKNLNLFGGNDGKETASGGQVEEGGPLPGDLLDPGRGEAGAQGEGEGPQDIDGGAVLRSDGDQVRPEDGRAQGEAQQEGDPFDEDEGPETHGEDSADEPWICVCGHEAGHHDDEPHGCWDCACEAWERAEADDFKRGW
jgi:site-specific DNA-methyltransferase (adenine-specific)